MARGGASGIAAANPSALCVSIWRKGFAMSRKARGPRLPRVLKQQEAQYAGDFRLVQGTCNVPPGATEVPRMHLHRDFFPFDAQTVAQSIAFNPRGLVFCDSTQFLAPTDERIWEVLLPTKRLAIVRPLVDELRLWVADPRGVNLRAHAAVTAALNGSTSTPVRIVEGPPSEALMGPLVYYIRLLGIRKHGFAITREKLERERGGPVSNQEVSDYLRDTGGTPRAQLLGKQGDNPKVAEHLYNDERLVACALIEGIATGQEVTIVTSDEAVLDQFFKGINLLSWHYLAMLLAERYSNEPLRFETREVDNPDSSVFAGDKVVLVPKSSALPFELLPRTARHVFLHCVLIQRDVTRASFLADRDMVRMLHVKHRTGGLNTDRLQGKNCHLFPCEAAREECEGYAVIASDKTAPAGHGMSVSALDLGLSITSNERATWTRMVDPRVLELPFGFRTNH